MSKIVVIGANHAGTAAINTILDNYSGNEVEVFDSNSNISFLGCGMALWIGGQIDGPEGLFYSSKEILEGKGAKIHMETAVDHVDFENKIVYATGLDGTKYEASYDKLILATGSLPIIPDIEGRNLKNVQQVKIYQNAEECISRLQTESIQNVVVVGGGYIGVELAEAFQRWGKTVTLLDLAPTCLSTYYDETFTKLMEDNLKEHGITLAFNEKVIRLEGTDKVERVITEKNSYQADMVVLAIGFRPNNQLGKDTLELFKNGAYVVDKTQKTSLDDVCNLIIVYKPCADLNLKPCFTLPAKQPW